jgi:methanogenic corrinoid protein MtbC1
LNAAGLRPGVKVMVGGGSLTPQVLEYVGADALGVDAQAAVNFANQWTAEMEVA